MKKFKLTTNTRTNAFGVKLYQIECAVETQHAKVGDLGGWIEKEENLDGNAWVYDNAQVSGDARVYGDARVFGNAQVYGNAWVSGDAQVSDNAQVSGDAQVYGNAWVCDDAQVSGDADYCCFQSFGSCGRTTTAFREKNGNVRIVCGCFSGTLDEFVARVKETHSDDRYAREYLAIAEVIKAKFGL